jgi:hypothetical protein
MSIKIMQLVWNITLPAPKKLVLLALADNANDEGDCYPSIATLIRKCSLSERAVQYAITELVEAGHVSRDVRSGRSTVYRVHPRTSCTPAPDAPVQVVHRTPAPDAPHPRTSCTHNHHITTKEPKNAELSLHESLPRDAWDEWISHRREKRWSLSPRALKPQLKLLAKYDSETQRDILETSQQAGWQGLFPPKGKAAAKPANGGGKDPYKGSI